MNKRITSLLLCFVMIFSMLVTAVPVFAEGPAAKIYITANKTEALPGDTITYTLSIGPVTDMANLTVSLLIPSSLTYVANSAKIADGLDDLMKNVQKAEFDESKLKLDTNDAEGTDNKGYDSTTDTKLMTFECRVADNAAAGTVKIGLDVENFYMRDDDLTDYVYSFEIASVTVTAAPKPATGITLNKSTLSLVAGNSETLTATVEPTDTTDTVVWSSDNTSVATVDNTGKVTGVAAGTAKITATAGTKSATCTVTVTCLHNHTTIPAKASDCTNRGWDEYMVCSKCNEVQSPTGEVLSGIPYRNLDENAHDFDTTAWGYKGADGHAHLCKLNAAHHDTPVAHTPDRTAATETLPVKCTECGYVIANATGHVHANHLTYVAAKAATCTTAGNKEYYECSCGKLFADGTASVETTADGVVLPASGHSYTVQNSDEAHKRSTASDCREYDTYWYTCANDASHNAKDDTVATDKYYNTDRGTHAYSADWTACGESGHAHKCLYDDSTVDLTAHRPDRTEPTETEAVKCLDCDYVITPELGHTHSLVKVEGKDADCNENGIKEHYKCESCNKLFEDATRSVEITDESTLVIPATGHSFVWVTDKEATEAETGLKHEECTVCHEKRNENTVIDKLAKADKADNASKNNAKESPKTGDDSSMGAWGAILFVSGGVLLVTGFYGRKRRSRAE